MWYVYATMTNFYSLFIHRICWNAVLNFCSCYRMYANVIIVRVNCKIRLRFDISWRFPIWKCLIYLSDLLLKYRFFHLAVVVQFRAIVCTAAIAYFLSFLYFNILIKHIFVASCFRYLKDVRKRKYENYFSNNIYR